MSVASATAGGYGAARPRERAWREHARFVVHANRPALDSTGTMYAIGHGSVVFTLGLLAILAHGVCPTGSTRSWSGSSGVTLFFLSVYLFYSLFRFFAAERTSGSGAVGCWYSPVSGTCGRRVANGSSAYQGSTSTKLNST